MADVKRGSTSSTGQITALKGTVEQIDANNIASVVLSTGQRVQARVDMLRGKSIAPQPGENWILDQPYGSGWMFAVPLNYTGGDQGLTTPALTNGWTAVSSPYQPVGYMLNAEGEVLCQGRLTGGTSGQAAFTLPSGYRPGGTIPFVVCVGTGSGLVTVKADGTVTPAGSGDVSLEQVRFLADS